MIRHHILLVTLLVLASCSGISLKKTSHKNPLLRLGVLGFKITAPIKHLADIASDTKDKELSAELKRRETKAKEFFFQYFTAYYKDIELIDVPLEEVEWEKGLNVSDSDLKLLQQKYQLDGLLLGEIPWYGKTNMMWPLIGFTADIVVETVIIGIVTKWNGPLLVANLGWEVATNGPLWFGGAWLFGQAYKPVTIETKLVTFVDGIHHHTEDFEVTKSRHLLEKYPEAERHKVENQLDASLRKALKEIAIEIAED